MEKQDGLSSSLGTRELDALVAEQWLTVPWNTDYSVSDQGHVASYKRRATAGKLLRLHFDERGYAIVQFWKDGECQAIGLHRLMLLVFKGEAGPGYQAAHKDGDPLNNSLGNLYWASPKENVNDKWGHGTMPLGEATNSVKLTEPLVRWMRRLYADGVGCSSLGRMFGVNKTTAHRVTTRRTWKHVT